MKKITISLIIGAALVFSPMTVNAQTVISLQAQIQNLLSLITQLQQQITQLAKKLDTSTTSVANIFTNTRDNYQVTPPSGVTLTISPLNSTDNPAFLGSASELSRIPKVTINVYNGTIDKAKKALADSYKSQMLTFGQDVPMIINGNQARKVTAYFDGKGGSPVYYIQYEPNRTLIVHSSEDVAKSVGTLRSVKSASGNTCTNITRNLWLGQSGTGVRQLQQFLRSTGDYTYPKITGYYGPTTQLAVQNWQRKNGVVSYGTPNSTGYGVVGPKTRAKITNGCGSQITISPTSNIQSVRTYSYGTYKLSVTVSNDYTAKLFDNTAPKSIQVMIASKTNGNQRLNIHVVESDYCLYGYCFITPKKVVNLSGMQWNYLGTQQYSDAYSTGEVKYVYSYKLPKYVVYVTSNQELQTTSNKTLLDIFSSIRII